MRVVIINYSFFTGDETETQILSDWPQVTKLINGKAVIQTQAVWL